MKNLMLAFIVMLLVGSIYGLSINITPIVVNGNVVGYNTNVTGTGIVNGLLNYSSNINVTINNLPLNVSYTKSDTYSNGKFFKVVNLNKVNKIYNISIGENPIINTTLNYTINPPPKITNFGIVNPSFTNQTRVFVINGVNVTTQVLPIPKLNLNKTLTCGEKYNNTNYGIFITTNNCINKVYNIKYPFNLTNTTYNYSINVFPNKLNINKTLLINQNYTNKTFNITFRGMSGNSLDNLTIFNYTFLENQYTNRYIKGCNFTVTKANFTYCAVGLPELFYGSVISNKNITEGWNKALTLFINNVSNNYTYEKEVVLADSNEISLLSNNLTNLRNGLAEANQVSASYNNLIDVAGEVALLVAIFIIILIIYNEHRKKNIITAKRL